MSTENTEIIEERKQNVTNHPEWKKENSLTSPADRDTENRWRPEQGVSPLTQSETEEAMKELNNTTFVDRFPRVDRTYQDDPIPMQMYGLFSFVPAKGATPDKHGVYGYAKLRGNYATQVEADQRAEHIIRNIDSYHQIYHTYVGRPFPCTTTSKYSAETKEIDVRRRTAETISHSVKEKRDEEQKTVREIKEREEQLLVDSNTARENDEMGDSTVDTYENYITLRVKKAQLTWTFLEHLHKLEEVRNVIIKTRNEIQHLDTQHPQFQDTFLDKYMEARKQSGLDTNVRDNQDNFIRYLVEDVKIPTIDTDEVIPSVEFSLINQTVSDKK
jgi:vacuolar-type H+-ATPase subunit I/STV1